MGGVVENWYPGGEKLRTVEPPLEITADTLQVSTNGRRTLESPAGRSLAMTELPHESRNCAGEANKATAHTKSSVWFLVRRAYST